jgi:hypothetical protein
LRKRCDPWCVRTRTLVYDPTINDMSPDASRNIAMVAHADAAASAIWALTDAPDGQCYGMAEAELLRLYRGRRLPQRDGAQDLRRAPRVPAASTWVKPFVMQAREANGDAGQSALEAHDTHFFGENISAADCGIPKSRFNWMPTRQPSDVIWEMGPPPPGAYAMPPGTTKAEVHATAVYYWTDREFEVRDVPLRRDWGFELAVGVDRATSAG